MVQDLIRIRQSERYPSLSVKKYHRKVFFKNLWNTDPELIESRGHVINEKGETVVRPFTKVFNRGENNTDIPLDEECLAVQKINGFMCAATYVEEVGEVVISTTGSLDSGHVTLAEKYIDKEKIPKGYTFLFEIVDKSDPHIIEEREGAYLIGMRKVDAEEKYTSTIEKEKRLDDIATMLGYKRPTYFVSSFNVVVDMAKVCFHEGYVVYGKDTVLKLKSPYYITLKALARKKGYCVNWSHDARRAEVKRIT